jgi:Na+-transporting NADH:ubiquinone oxidoreductase subunit F
MCFVGGGAGMAPMRSHIFDQLKRLKHAQDDLLVRCAQPEGGLLRRRVRRKLQAEHPNFKWHLALSEPLPEDNWTGPTGFHPQRLRDQYLAKHPAPEDIEYYMCGPDVMNKAVIDMLLSLGVDRENIMLDDFGLIDGGRAT